MTTRLPEDDATFAPPTPGTAVTGTAATRPSRVRRYTLIGLSAGLLGGAAVGLAGTLPLESHAAGLPQLTAAPEPTPTVPNEPTAAPDVPAPGTWLRDTLQPLVDDGTLTNEQLEAVVGALDAARPAGPFGRGDRGPGEFGRGRAHVFLDREELAAVLGIDLDTLAEELRSGTSLAEVAEQHGVDVETVIDVLVADAEARIADRVADGTLTDEEAAERLAEVRQRVTEMVNRSRPTAPIED